MMYWYVGSGGWAVMTLMMVAFWGLLLGGAVAVYRSTRREDRAWAPARADAGRLLDERFARGEVDPEDYRARRELLRSGH